MKVIFSDRAYVSILAETTEKIKTETGGLFLGAIDSDQWYIVEAIDPGPESVFEVDYFEYDQKYTQHLINKIANLYNEQLYLIGLWHRHPGSFDQFSSTDDITNSKYANMRLEGAISVLVNVDPFFRITAYHVEQPCKYSIIEYEVGDHLIPDELLKYKNLKRFKQIVNNPFDKNNEKALFQMNLYQFMQCIMPYLEKYKLNVKNICYKRDVEKSVLDEIIDDVTYMIDECQITLSIVQTNSYICISNENSQNEIIKLYFGYIESLNKIAFCLKDNYFKYEKKEFIRAFAKYKEEQCNKKKDSKTTYNVIKMIKKMIKNGENK